MSHDIAARLQAILEDADQQNVLVEDVTRAFRKQVMPRYKDSPGHRCRLTRILDWLDDEYCDQPADSFGPKRLREMRDRFVKQGNCRKYCNEQTRDIVRIFKFAVAEELIRSDQLAALKALEPLKPGECHDNPKRRVVTLEEIETTFPRLKPMLQAMIRIQLGTGCRPGEVFAITPGIIDRSDHTTWWARPTKHKTAHFGITKSFPLIGDAREALMPYMLKGTDDFCFTTRRGNPWQRNSYRNEIHKAAEKAGVRKWSPYSIRHLAATTVRQKLGLEAAKALLGHTSSKVTEEHYAGLTEREALEAARVAPKIG